MALASMDFPVPGDPIIITWRRWVAAFRITSTAWSCPMTWSMSFGGTSISEDTASSSPPSTCSSSFCPFCVVSIP